jgi:hypothetical protein
MILYILWGMKSFLSIIVLLSFTINAIAQNVIAIAQNVNPIAQSTSKESAGEKEPVAVAELGGATSWNFRGGGWSFGYSAAVEVTPIENWLELELGVSPAFGAHLREWDIDLLFKKPWTFSPKAEFMFGVGLAWTHANDHNLTTNSVGGEIALDFMFWPAAKHRFGWYLEPAYEYDFGGQHQQSAGLSAGLLVGIP